MRSALIIFALLITATTVRAHRHERPDLSAWFSHLTSGRGLCCDSTEATSIDDPDWESNDGLYRVRIEGQWIDVPPNAVVDEPNKFGPALVWPYIDMNGRMQIRCFLPGAGA